MEASGSDTSRIAIEAIIVLGGVITTWLTLKYQQARKRNKKPTHIDTIYEGYEKLIIQQQQEISRKTEVVNKLEEAVDLLERELSDTKKLLQETKDDLYDARQSNIEMKKQLAEMRQK